MKCHVFVSAALAALAAFVASARADDPKHDDLAGIVADYVASGELDKAVAALAKKKVTAKQLLAALREPPRLEAPIEGGLRSFELRDGHGRKTDLKVVAPPTSAIQARAKKGLGLVVLLHGLKGNAGQCVPYATELAATNEVVAVAPSAQPLPAGFGPEDGIPDSMGKTFPHWWLYESSRSFPLEAIKKACALFPIDPDRIVLCGVSMGGYGTWNIGLRHPDRFAAISPLAGGLTRLAQAGMRDDRTAALLENGRLVPVFAAHGDKDGVVPYGPDKEAADKLKELGGDVTFHTLEGVGHDIKEAMLGDGKIAADLKKFVTTKRRRSPQLDVTYVSLSEKLDGAYWLRIAKRTGKDRARIEGSIDKAHNRIRIAGDGVELARVYLDDRILDLSKPVTIEAGGEVRFQGRVAPETRAILESWRSRGDERLVYPACVEVDPR